MLSPVAVVHVTFYLLLAAAADAPPVYAAPSGALEGTVVSIAGYEARVCEEASCQGRCGDNESPVCQCDDVCMLLGDCCLDYQAVCRTNTSFRESNLTAEYLERRSVQEAMKTGPICPGKGKITTIPFVQVVSKCPNDYTGNREACENCTYTGPTVHNLMPVYSEISKLVFKNEYCAACHHHTDVVHIPLNMSCSAGQNMRYAGKWYLDGGLEEMLKKIVTEEDLYSNPVCYVFIRLYHVQQELPLWRLQAPGGQGFQKSADELNYIARSYSSPIIPARYHNSSDLLPDSVMRRYHIQLNWHAIYGRDPGDYICTRYNYTYLPDPDPDLIKKVTVHYRQGITKVYYGDQLLCHRKTHIADILSESCIAKSCPVAHVQRNGNCYSVPPSTQDKIKGLYRSTLDITVVTRNYVNTMELQSLDIVDVVPDLLFVGPIEAKWAPVSCSSLPGLTAEHCMLFVLSGPPVNMLLSVTNFNTIRTKLFNEIVQLVGEVSYIGMKNFETIDGVSCVKGRLQWLEQPAVVTDGVEKDDFWRKDGIRVVNQKRSLTYTSTMTAVSMMWRVTSNGFISLSNQSVAVCVSNTSLLTCPTVELKDTEYERRAAGDGDTVNLALLGNGDHKKLSLSRDHVIFDENNTAVMCEKLFQQSLKSASSKVWLHPWFSILQLALILFK